MSLQRQLRATLQTTLVLTGILAVTNAFPQTPEPSTSVLLAQAATYERQFEREFEHDGRSRALRATLGWIQP